MLSTSCASTPRAGAPTSTTTALGATSISTSISPQSDPIDGTWNLQYVTVDEQTITLDGWPPSRTPWIRFQPSLEGWTGCNSFYSYDQPQYRLSEDLLTFEHVVIENAGCEGSAQSEVEAIITEFLWNDRGVLIAIDGGHMTWTQPGGGAVAQFVADD